MRFAKTFAAAVAILSGPTPSFAWGFEGHRIVADIARSRLAPNVRAKVDAILATDTSPLTDHDMASEATWADAYRAAAHRETAQWHFVDQEIDGSADLKAACFGMSTPGQPASVGPAQDCVVNKIRKFAAELADPGAAADERLLAFKFLLHFVGDVHQPLHASDNHDRGGNCVLLSLGGTRTINLHAYWDTTVVEALGRDPDQVATELERRITTEQAAMWQAGDAVAWAGESLLVAKSFAYALNAPPGCQADISPISLPPGYEEAAKEAAALQLEKAGLRLATILNRSLGAKL